VSHFSNLNLFKRWRSVGLFRQEGHARLPGRQIDHTVSGTAAPHQNASLAEPPTHRKGFAAAVWRGESSILCCRSQIRSVHKFGCTEQKTVCVRACVCGGEGGGGGPTFNQQQEPRPMYSSTLFLGICVSSCLPAANVIVFFCVVLPHNGPPPTCPPPPPPLAFAQLAISAAFLGTHTSTRSDTDNCCRSHESIWCPTTTTTVIGRPTSLTSTTCCCRRCL
jgi:hypothetical protein